MATRPSSVRLEMLSELHTCSLRKSVDKAVGATAARLLSFMAVGCEELRLNV